MRDIADMQEQMNKLFEDFFGRRAFGEGYWHPTLDVSETEDDIIVRAELPGIDKEDVSISITKNILSIKGEKKKEDKIEGENFYRVERSYGSFHRKIELPSEVDSDKVEATTEDGILKIVLPKSEAIKPREIEIKVGSSSKKKSEKKDK
jgi:HSP20 family protein